jgi:hypothetical protein
LPDSCVHASVTYSLYCWGLQQSDCSNSSTAGHLKCSCRTAAVA